MPRVSVVIAVYNAKDYLHQCLNSIISQTLTDIEIICVDDGSTDESADIIREYMAKDSRIRLLTQNNQFAGVARNNGLAKASGEYVIFLDSDDFFESDMLELAYHKIASTGADICVFNSNLYDDEKQCFKEYDWAFREEFFKSGEVFSPAVYPNNENIFRMFNGWAWDKLIRRDYIIEKQLLFQDLRTTNDMYFTFMALAEAKKVVTLDKILAHQRVNISKSLSQTREKSWNNFYLGLKAMEDELKRTGLYECYRRAFLNWCVNFSLWQLNTMSGEAFINTYNLLHDKAIREFGILAEKAEYYYSEKEYQQISLIANEPLLPMKPDQTALSGKSSMPLVSVIMPSLNVGDYMYECLKSVTDQTLENIEIICVDAGSTDQTVSIIETMMADDTRIKLIHSDRKSYGYQVNLGIKNATGKYIGIVETDDFISKEMYMELAAIAENNNLDVVKSNHFRTSAKEETFAEGLKDLTYNQVFSPKDQLVLFQALPSIWNGLYKRAFLLENHIFCLESPGASYQDTGFIIKVWTCAKRIMLVKKPYYHYRTDNENSSVKSSGKIYCVCDEFESVKQFVQAQKAIPSEVKKMIVSRKAATYHWNAMRLSDSCRLDFLYRISTELKADMKAGLIDKSYFNNVIWRFVNEVIASPEIFFFREKKDFIYTKEDFVERLETADIAEEPVMSFVICPTESFDRNLLYNCLDSVLKQTVSNIEVLLITTSAMDQNVLETVAGSDARISFIDVQDVLTFSGVRSLLDRLKGNYIYMLQPDSFIRRDFCESFLKESHTPQQDLYLINGYSFVKKDGSIIKENHITQRYIRKKESFQYKDVSDGMFYLLSRSNLASVIVSKKTLSDALMFKEFDNIAFTPRCLDILLMSYAGSMQVLNERFFFKEKHNTPYPALWRTFAQEYQDIKTILNTLELYEEREKDFANFVIFNLNEALKRVRNADDKQRLITEINEVLAAEAFLSNEDTYFCDQWAIREVRGMIRATQWLKNYENKQKSQEYTIFKSDNAPVDPIVSVIIPVYNTEEYVGECIDSIRDQTLQNIEIICVNDGSTDSSLQVLREYASADSRITLIDQPNCGQSHARNVGLSVAKGNYISFIDSDDYLEADALSSLVSRMDSDVLDIAFFEGSVFFLEEDAAKMRGRMNPENYIRHERYDDIYSGKEYLSITQKNNDYRVSPCMQLIRKSFLLNNHLSFYEGIFYEDNLATFTFLMHAKRVGHIHRAFYQRRLVPSSTTMQAKRFDHVYGYFKCYFEMMKMIQKDNDSSMAQKSVFWDVAMENLRNAITNYKATTPEERNIYFALPTEEYYLFENQVAQVGNRDLQQMTTQKNLKKQLADVKMERDHLKASTSFRLGRKLLDLPIKLKKAKNRV